MNKNLVHIFSLALSLFSFNAMAQHASAGDSLNLSFDKNICTSLINPPNISMVVSDDGDPATVNGVGIDISWRNQPLDTAAYSIKASSSNTSVVTDDNISITRNNGNVIIKVKPYSVGYTTITVTITRGNVSKSMDINFAISQAGFYNTEKTYWHTGISDASAAIALDSSYMIIGDDETNELAVYNRNESGLPVASFQYGDLLGLTDGNRGNYKKVDVEAAAQSPRIAGRMYWLGSMSNSKNANVKPDRNRIFATTVSGTGSTTSIAMSGYYSDLRGQIIKWGNAYGYHLSASAGDGQNAKMINGFNAEGMVFAPDSSTLYIGMRAPLVPVINRTKALIVPIKNFESWFNNGMPSGNPPFGNPIELDLGGRGIRDMNRLSNGYYIIVAGSADETSFGAIFIWSGQPADAPVILPGFDITTLKAEGVLEIDDAHGKIIPNELQIISDNGNDVYYGDGNKAKDLSENNYKKFHSDIIVSTTSALDTIPIGKKQ